MTTTAKIRLAGVLGLLAALTAWLLSKQVVRDYLAHGIAIADFGSLRFWTLFGLLVLVSIDNGGLLAHRALKLPKDAPVPWPHFLPPWVINLFERLGMKDQRHALPWMGLWFSLPMKATFALFGTLLIGLDFIKVLGGLYFLKIVIEYVLEYIGEAHHGETPRTYGRIHSILTSYFGWVPAIGAFVGTVFGWVMWPIKWVTQPIWRPYQTWKEGLDPFWKTVVTVDVEIEAGFSLDETLAAAIRTMSWLEASVGMVLSTFFMRLTTGPFQRLMQWEPLIIMSIYAAIAELGVHMIASGFHAHLYPHSWEPIEPFMSFIIIVLFLLGARLARFIGWLPKVTTQEDVEEALEPLETPGVDGVLDSDQPAGLSRTMIGESAD